MGLFLKLMMKIDELFFVPKGGDVYYLVDVSKVDPKSNMGLDAVLFMLKVISDSRKDGISMNGARLVFDSKIEKYKKELREWERRQRIKNP